MFRHALVLTVAVATALGTAHQMMKLSDAHAAAVARTESVQTGAPQTDASQTGAAASESAPVPSEAQVVKATDGHFWAEAEVDGRWIHCLIDTGASEVALTRDDAERLGLDASTLAYDVPVVTANGKTYGARVQLDYVAVAGAKVEQVPALVIADGLSSSLLGMSYLGRLSRFEATPTSLVLRR